MGEDGVQAEKSSMVSPHETQELVVPSPSPVHSSPSQSQSLTLLTTGQAQAEGALHDGSQVSAITVLTLLNKLVNMLDVVQENQHKMEHRQTEMDHAIRGIQSDMTKLSKSHSSTSNTVSKLLEKSRKVSVHMKEVKDKMDKQATQVRKLEANHAHLLKRNNFKVLIFQEENEIPSSAFVKDAVPYPRGTEGEELVDSNKPLEETLQTVNLSSDEEICPDEEEEGSLHEEKLEQSRAEKIKRSSLKRVDSLKKAFSRQNIEKKMSKIGTKIVSPEKREKIKKSLTPNHQKTSSSKSSSFKVTPLTFNVKKNREGETSVTPNTPTTARESPTAMASIELEPLSSPGEDVSFSEVHSELSAALDEVKAAADSLQKEIRLEESSVAVGDMEMELTIMESLEDEAEILEYTTSSTLRQEEQQPSAEETSGEPAVQPAVLNLD
ncbi:Serum deprivation-response protein [Acipenser ruthenus]|uniref:Serum deprivation-response protein n=1 Tax=Acipenser ruthenus TaxID=7906 RepID=A0A444TXY9_ACIRT|nr:caveolae-associated protein 2-like [Acipenser ruthenus]RXM27816.1 Serum deprivation-response protein [Acipenser ruthenus]